MQKKIDLIDGQGLLLHQNATRRLNNLTYIDILKNRYLIFKFNVINPYFYYFYNLSVDILKV